MFQRIALAACALVLLMTTAGVAQQVITGTVVRVDEPASVIVLNDGRMIQVSSTGRVLVSAQPVVLSSLQPGAEVTIHGGKLVSLRDGQYIVIAEPAPATVVTTPAPTTTTTVTSPPAATATTAPFEVSGRATHIDTVSNVIILDGWRAIPLTPDMQVLVDNRQVALDAIPPGSHVTIRSLRPIRSAGSGKASRVEGNRLSDERAVETTPHTVVIVDHRPAPMASVRTDGEPMPASMPGPPPLTLEAGLKEYEQSRQAPGM